MKPGLFPVGSPVLAQPNKAHEHHPAVHLAIAAATMEDVRYPMGGKRIGLDLAVIRAKFSGSWQEAWSKDRNRLPDSKAGTIDAAKQKSAPKSS